ncbi:hypothetical protein KY321_04860 [Candidatus Woesearchaeota archaeon]|nr:hypothetical protein [Candidatus Woesearchaeota archaeon]
MKLNEIVKNITEIQDPFWISNLQSEELIKIENNFWLIWQKIKQINDIEIIEPLQKLSEFLTETKLVDGKIKTQFKTADFSHFYSLCINLIPKKKYSFISSRKRKNKDYDYEFLKLLAKEYNESVRNCEEYYDIFEELGTLEKEKKRLFSKYGVFYDPNLNDKIEALNINSIKLHPLIDNSNFKLRDKEYLRYLKRIETFGQLEPITIDKKTSYVVCGIKRYLCMRELGLRKIQVIKRSFYDEIEKLISHEVDYKQFLTEQLNSYKELKNKIKSIGYKKRKKLMGGKSMRDYVYQQTGISQSQGYKLEYIEKHDPNLFNELLENKHTIRSAYNQLRFRLNRD